MLLVTLILSDCIPVKKKKKILLNQQNTDVYGSERTCFRFASFYVSINVSLPVVSYFERVHEKHSVGTLWPRRNHSNNEKAPKARWVEGAGEANTQQCDTLLERS